MDQDSINRAWDEYLKNENDPTSITPTSWRLPAQSVCGTCAHWRLIDEDALSLIADTNKAEYERILDGMEGKLYRAVRENGEVVDGYSYQLFHGFCTRYPPAAHAPLQVADYGFPLTSHTNTCGEWQKAPEDTGEDED